MKKLIFVLFILFFSNTIIFAETPQTWGIRWDRTLHFQSGFMISVTSIMWSKRYFNKKENYWPFSVGLPFLVGYLKECNDHKTFNFKKWQTPNDPYDAYIDVFMFVLGGVVGELFTYTF